MAITPEDWKCENVCVNPSPGHLPSGTTTWRLRALTLSWRWVISPANISDVLPSGDYLVSLAGDPEVMPASEALLIISDLDWEEHVRSAIAASVPALGHRTH